MSKPSHVSSGGKMADGLGQGDYTEIGPNQAPAKTPMLEESERIQLRQWVPKTNEEYLALTKMYGQGDHQDKWPAFLPGSAQPCPLTVETVLAALMQVLGGHVEKALWELLYVTIPKYRPDLYAATRYINRTYKSQLMYHDAVALFVYTIELYDPSTLEKAVGDLEPREVHAVLEKMFNQRELDVITTLQGDYLVSEGEPARRVYHKVWDELFMDSLSGGNLSEQEIVEHIKNLRASRMSEQGASEMLRALHEGQVTIKTLLDDEVWLSTLKVKVRSERDIKRLERVCHMLRAKRENHVKINLGDFGAGSSMGLQLYGGMNRSLRELESANAAQIQLLESLPVDGSTLLPKESMRLIDKAVEVFNAKLRSQKEFAKWKYLFFTVTDALFRLPIDTKKPNTFRGINVEFSEKQYSTGKYFAWPAFSSTSGKRSEALKFTSGGSGTGTLFIITDLINGCDVHLFSRFPEEDEVLLPPQSYFRVVHRTSEMENIVNRSGPIITVNQLHLADVDKHLECPISRMVWITHFNAARQVPFPIFEQLHLDGTLRGPVFDLIRRIWSELKNNQNINSGKYIELIRHFSPHGAENPTTAVVTLEGFAHVSKGSPGCLLYRDHAEQLALLNQRVCFEKNAEKRKLKVSTGSGEESLKRCVILDGEVESAIIQRYDYHDYLSVLLRGLKRNTDTILDDTETYWLIEGHAGGSYLDCHLDSEDNVVLTLRAVPRVSPVVLSAGGHVAFAHEEQYRFLTVASTASKSLYLTVSEHEAAHTKRLVRRSEMVQNNLFFLYLDDFDASLEARALATYDVLCLEVCQDQPAHMQIVVKNIPATHGEATVFDTKDFVPLFLKKERKKNSPFHHLYKSAAFPLHHLETDGFRRTYIPIAPSSFLRRSAEYMLPFLIEPIVTAHRLFLEPEPNRGLRRQDRNERHMDEYLPYPWISVPFWAWSTFLPTSFLAIAMIVALIFCAFLTFIYVNPVLETMMYLAVMVMFVLIICFNIVRKQLVCVIAENAPHAQSRGSWVFLGFLFLIIWAGALNLFPPYFSYARERWDQELLRDTDFGRALVGIPPALVGIALLVLVWLFTVTNQIMYDRAANLVDEVRCTPAETFVNPKPFITNYLKIVSEILEVSNAWRPTAQFAVAALFFAFTFSCASLYVTLSIGEEKLLRPQNFLQITYIITYISATLFFLMYLLRRWEKFSPGICQALAARFREVSPMPGTTPENLSLIVNTVNQHPVEWTVPSFTGTTKINTWMMALVLGFLHISLFLVLFLSTTPEFCTIQLSGLGFTDKNVFSIGLPQHGDPPRLIPAMEDMGRDKFLTVSRYRVLPGYDDRDSFGIHSCQIVGCETGSKMGNLRRVDAFFNVSVCSEMFSLETMSTNDNRVSAPFVSYRLRVNTDKEIWKIASDFTSSNQGVFVLMQCTSEIGVHVERMCMWTQSKEVFHMGPRNAFQLAKIT